MQADEKPVLLGTFITGIVSERSGRPLASARCELRPSVPSGGFIPHAERTLAAVATTATAPDGAFRIEAGPGFWSLAIESPGHCGWERDHLLAGDDLLVRLDAEVLLRVSVVDPEGAPVEGAELLVHAASAAAPGTWRCRLSTDPRGQAETTSLAPGKWILSVRHPDHAVVGVPLHIPVGLRRLEKEIRLERGTRLAGTVRTEEGSPIGGAHVRIESPYRNVFLWDELTCDESGRYATGSLYSPQETLEVLASAAGYAESQAWVGIQPAQASAGVAVRDFVLPRAGRTLRGRAVSSGGGVPGASIRYCAIDPVGSSAADTITAIQIAPRAPWLWQEATRTDGTGAFELAGLSDAPQYVLMVVHEPHAPRVVWVPPGESGSLTELGNVELLPCGGLFGRATFANGAPAEGLTLELYKVNQVMVTEEQGLGTWRPDSWFQPLTTLVAADGHFRFDLLTPGAYQFLTVPSGDIEVQPGSTTGPIEVMLPGGDPAEEHEVTGVVRNSAGEAVPMVFVQAFALEKAGERLHASCLVDARGAFQLRLPADALAHLVFMDLRGVHEEQDLHLDPVRTSGSLEVVLHERAFPLPPIDGIVLGPRGDVVEACTVTLHPPEDTLCGCISFQSKTDPAGAFQFSVSEGPHRLVTSDPRYASATHAPAWPGDHVVIDLDLE